MNASHTALVQCSCRACRKYATANDRPFPMQAMAIPAAVERIGASALVHAAYDPALAFASVRPSVPVNA